MITVYGTVDENGYLTLDEPLKLPPGKVTVRITSLGMSLEEAKAQLERQDVDWAALSALYDQDLAPLDNTGLPTDAADKHDDYLYRK